MAEENLGTAVLSIVVDSKGLEESLNKAKQQIQKTSRELQRSLTAAPINPATGRSLRDERNDPIKAAIRQRRADQRALQTASGSGLGRFLRDARTREEAEKRINRERQKGFDQGFRKGGARESINALTDAQKRRYGLEQQIRSLEAAGVNTAKLRAQLGEATTAQANRQFGSFNRIASALDFTLRKERDKLRVIRDQNTALERQATEGRRIGRLNASPVRGGLAFPGSPGALAAAQAEGRRIGGLNASPVRGGAAFPGSPAFLDAIFPKAARNQFEQAAKEIRAAASAPAKAAIQERRAQQRSLQTAGGGGGLTGFLRDVREREEGEKRITTERAKGYKQANFAENTLQTLAQKRSALTLQETRQRTRLLDQQKSALSGALSSAVIGGAFPLLFGQGGGAAAGGLIGGLFGSVAGQGGGFAGSLAGTLVGQQLDVFNELAKALQDPVANFKQLVEASNLSSKGLESYIQVLIESGRTAEAETAIRADISSTVDPVTLAQASAANEQYARTIADVQERLGTILSGPASQFVGWLEEVIKRIAFLPSPDQGPISPEGRQQLSLANRGAGTALGLGGTALAGISAVTGFFPGVLAGGAIAAAGGAQLSLGESQQDQIALSKLLKGAQQEVLAVEKQRIAAQNKLVSLQQQGSSTEAQKQAQAELQLQVGLLDIEAKRKKAKADFLARDASTESFQAYKLELDALKLTEKQLKTNNDLRKQAVAEQKRLSQIQAGIEASQSTLNLKGLKQQRENVLALQSTPAGVGRDRLAVQQAAAFANDEARRREQSLRDQISAAQQRGGETGAADATRLTNQLNEAVAETALVAEEGKLSLQEFNENARKQAFDELSKAVEEAANQAIQAADAFKTAQDRYTAAQQGLRSARESAFQFLSGSDQRQLVSAARSDIREAGFRNTGRLSDTEILSVGGVARNLTAAESELTLASNNVAASLNALSQKNWDVNVAVSGGQAAVYGDVVNGAVSP